MPVSWHVQGQPTSAFMRSPDCCDGGQLFNFLLDSQPKEKCHLFCASATPCQWPRVSTTVHTHCGQLKGLEAKRHVCSSSIYNCCTQCLVQLPKTQCPTSHVQEEGGRKGGGEVGTGHLCTSVHLVSLKRRKWWLAGQHVDMCPRQYIYVQWNLSIKDTLNKRHLPNEDTVCCPNHIYRAVY